MITTRMQRDTLVLFSVTLCLILLSPLPFPTYRSVNTASIAGETQDRAAYDITVGAKGCHASATKSEGDYTYFITAQHCVDGKKSSDSASIIVGKRAVKADIVAEGMQNSFAYIDWAVLKAKVDVPVSASATEEQYDELKSGNSVYYYHPEMAHAGFLGRVADPEYQNPGRGKMLTVNMFSKNGFSGSGLYHEGRIYAILSRYSTKDKVVYAVPIKAVPDKYLTKDDKTKRD